MKQKEILIPIEIIEVIARLFGEIQNQLNSIVKPEKRSHATRSRVYDLWMPMLECNRAKKQSLANRK